jgi:hypothetical protein
MSQNNNDRLTQTLVQFITECNLVSESFNCSNTEINNNKLLSMAKTKLKDLLDRNKVSYVNYKSFLRNKLETEVGRNIFTKTKLQLTIPHNKYAKYSSYNNNNNEDGDDDDDADDDGDDYDDDDGIKKKLPPVVLKPDDHLFANGIKMVRYYVAAINENSSEPSSPSTLLSWLNSKYKQNDEEEDNIVFFIDDSVRNALNAEIQSKEGVLRLSAVGVSYHDICIMNELDVSKYKGFKMFLGMIKEIIKTINTNEYDCYIKFYEKLLSTSLRC